MTVIKSKVNVQSDDFRANAESMRALVAELREKIAAVERGGSDEARQKHAARGKLLVRDRVNALLDPDTPFLELSPLAACEM
ncbi:MAG TPA: methylcrotonoyl-CoA carboxylase, partial [Burkholderiales bacterium]|nr:methylcrotonoyl-CoA carboxylase [Burkholderiales bacterium]